MTEFEKTLEDLRFEMKKQLNSINRYVDIGVSKEFKELFKEYCKLKGFDFVYDNANSLPRKVLTRYGIIELFKPYEEEWKVVSEINQFRSLRNDFYNVINLIGIGSYNRYVSKILYYLVTNDKELVNIINEKLDKTIYLDDIITNKYIEKLNVIKDKVIINNKKGNLRQKGNYYIRVNENIIKVDENNILYNVVQGGENVSELFLERKFRTEMQNARNEIRA